MPLRYPPSYVYLYLMFAEEHPDVCRSIDEYVDLGRDPESATYEAFNFISVIYNIPQDDDWLGGLYESHKVQPL